MCLHFYTSPDETNYVRESISTVRGTMITRPFTFFVCLSALTVGMLGFLVRPLPAQSEWTGTRGIRHDRTRCLGFNRQAKAARSFITGLQLMGAQPESHRVGVLRLEFQPDQDDSTTGNGLFGNLPHFHPDPGGGVYVDPDINSRSRFYYYKHLMWAREYFEASSRGLLTFAEMDTATDISPIIRLGQEMGVYGDNENFAENVLRFVSNAVMSADTLTTFDFSRYDALVLFHAGAGEESDFGPPPLYPGDSPRDLHSSYVPLEVMREYLGEGDPSYLGIPTTNDMGETTYVSSALILPETLVQDTVYNPSAVFLDILGVLVHEYGHHLGLPDLYDPAHPTRPAVGNFGLMGTGAYNSSARLPSEPIGWSKYYLGWLDVLSVNADTTGIELMAVEGPGEGTKLLKIPISSSEYYLLENRVRDRDYDGEFRFDDVDGDNWPDLAEDSYRLTDGTYTEFDYALPGIITYPDDPLIGSGVLIWHIDNEVIRNSFDPQFNDNCVNCNIARQGIDLEEADGIQHLDMLYPATIDPGYGSPFDSYGGRVAGVKDFGSLNLLFGPSTNPSSTSNLAMASHISVSGFNSLTLDPSGTLVDTIVSVDVSFGQKLPGFPVVLREEGALNFEEDPGIFIDNSLAASDLDGDGTTELIVVTRAGDLFLIDAEGHTFPEGSSVITPYFSVGSTVTSSPAIGNIHNDSGNDLEIVLLSEDGDLSVCFSDGHSGGDNLLPGFPVVLGGDKHRGPACYDIDGDGDEEVITTSLGGDGVTVNVIGADGLNLDGWPVTIDEESSAFPAVYPHRGADADPDSADVILVSEGGTVYRLSGGGQLLWQTSLGSTIQVPPVIADLDRDGDTVPGGLPEEVGDLEIAIGTLSGEIFVLSSQGVQLPGGAQSTGGQILSPFAASDVNMDGYVELVILSEGTSALNLYRMNDAGNALLLVEDFPKVLPAVDVTGSKNFFSSLVTADIDGAVGEEIIFGTRDNQIVIFDATSASSPIIQYPLGGDVISSPVVGDLDNDGIVDVIACDDRGYVYAWSTGMLYAESTISWDQLGGGSSRSFANTLPLLEADQPGSPVFSEDRMYVYPNPFKPAQHSEVRLHFEIDDNFRQVVVNIFDVSGRQVKTVEMFDDLALNEGAIFEQAFNIDDLPSGVYIAVLEVAVVGGERRRLFKKFAVLK